MKNSEIKIVGLIYTIIILVYMLLVSDYQNNKRLKMISQAITIIEEQDKRILDLEEGLQGMNEYADELETRLQDVDKLDTILKDLASSWKKK